ncbi:MAG: hypothetical protein JXA82_00325 [Sedimentisphaerales bacterium]|nr:hypothetical protein [Sedimentisphaerales bacterium]
MVLKANENPPILLPGRASIEDFEGIWWVAHTRSRNEKALAWQMLKKEIQYFLPMSPRAHKWRDRTIRSLMPIFTGYVFFCGNEEDRLNVLKTNRVANLIPVKDAEGLIHDLRPIEQVLLQGEILQPHPYIKKGQRCRVIAGPLMGIEGIVIREPSHMRLVLQVEMLGQATSVEIDVDLIEPLEE